MPSRCLRRRSWPSRGVGAATTIPAKRCHMKQYGFSKVCSGRVGELVKADEPSSSLREPGSGRVSSSGARSHAVSFRARHALQVPNGSRPSPVRSGYVGQFVPPGHWSRAGGSVANFNWALQHASWPARRSRGWETFCGGAQPPAAWLSFMAALPLAISLCGRGAITDRPADLEKRSSRLTPLPQPPQYGFFFWGSQGSCSSSEQGHLA